MRHQLLLRKMLRSKTRITAFSLTGSIWHLGYKPNTEKQCVSNSKTPADSASSSMQMGLDAPSHRQHGKLSLLPQDTHPALGSHPLQRFLLLQGKTLCFSWILAHQGLFPVHRGKKKTKQHKEYLKPQELWYSGFSLTYTSFPWRNK